MSQDPFAPDDTQKTPVTFKAPRTPSMTPTRSVKRRSSFMKRQSSTPNDFALKKEEMLATMSVTQHGLYEDYYNLRTRQVPLLNGWWEPIGNLDGSSVHGDTGGDLEPRSLKYSEGAGEGSKRIGTKNTKSSSCLRQFCFMVLCGFLGALCFALIMYFFLNTTCGSSCNQITQYSLDDQKTQPAQLENLVLRLSDEIKYLKDHYSKLQKNTCGEVIQSPQTGVLEELLTSDLACAGNLGKVLATPNTRTVTIPSSVKVLKLFSFNVQMYHNLPHTTLEGLIQNVGDCWPFEGSYGRLVLKLYRRSLVTGVSISHIPITISATGDISSAPRHFQVLVYQQEDNLDNGLILGEFEYKIPGAWRQTFPLEQLHKEETLVDIIEFRFLNNHGNPNYTCIYRVHVHGRMT